MADPALDLAAALRLADKLDMAVMHMLESCATDEAAAEERGNSLEGPSKEVASAVTQLERLLENLQVPAPSKKEQLEQEITELEKELQSRESIRKAGQKSDIQSDIELAWEEAPSLTAGVRFDWIRILKPLVSSNLHLPLSPLFPPDTIPFSTALRVTLSRSQGLASRFSYRQLHQQLRPLLGANFSSKQGRQSSLTMAAAAPPKRGAFIVMEGIDRCGKTTQAAKLVEHLNATVGATEMWRFPDRTTTSGIMIDSYLRSQIELDDAAVHLLFSANRHEKRASILRALEAGTNLVVDRYSYSGIAYTSAKGVTGLDAEWCKHPEQGLPAPDLVLYMKLSPEASAKRGGFGEERYEKAEMQAKVSQIFETLKDDRWTVIDADQPIEAVQKQVAEVVDAVLAKIDSTTPVGKLWGASPVAAAPAAAAEPESAFADSTNTTALSKGSSDSELASKRPRVEGPTEAPEVEQQ
eukprot:gene11667-34381_t